MRIKPSLIKKTCLLFGLIFGTISSIYAQDGCKDELIKRINQRLSVDLNVFPDSTKIWTFALKIVITKIEDSTRVTAITTKHRIGQSLNASFAALRSIDYSCIMEGKKQRELVIPFCIVIYGSEIGGRMLSLDHISQDIERLFDNTDNKGRVIYHNPYIIHADKRVYD